jgi:hypothetical protein
LNLLLHWVYYCAIRYAIIVVFGYAVSFALAAPLAMPFAMLLDMPIAMPLDILAIPPSLAMI